MAVALDKERAGSGVGLKILNTNKTKILNLMGYFILSACIIKQSVEGVDQFVYLGSAVSLDDTKLDAAQRINNRSAFGALSKT